MKLVKIKEKIPTLVQEYKMLETYLTGLGYDVSELTLDQTVKIKLAIQDVIDEINL
jgi:hypothetical protein